MRFNSEKTNSHWLALSGLKTWLHYLSLDVKRNSGFFPRSNVLFCFWYEDFFQEDKDTASFLAAVFWISAARSSLSAPVFSDNIPPSVIVKTPKADIISTLVSDDEIWLEDKRTHFEIKRLSIKLYVNFHFSIGKENLCSFDSKKKTYTQQNLWLELGVGCWIVNESPGCVRGI